MREDRKCIQCNNIFIWYTSHKNINGGKFCSIKCCAISRKQNIERYCEICSNRFYTSQSFINVKGARFCSRKCYFIHQSKLRFGKENIKIRGDKSHFWRGGVTPKNKIDRLSCEYNKWRSLVLNRDNFICQKCGTNKRPFNAHHIKSFSKFPELRFDLNNGITLCLVCHKEAHEKDKFNHIIGLGNGRLRQQRDKLEGESQSIGN